MIPNASTKLKSLRVAFAASVGIPFVFASNAFAQLPAPAVPAASPATAEVERVVVTGSNIPTAEETGPNPVDTYRPQDIEKLGIRNATDLQEFIPQAAGGTLNLNIGNGGDGTVQFNLRGLLPKETLVLIDGKRVAYGSLGLAGANNGPDINLIPFSMVDHVDILKDGASAVYGSDAIAGVVNFFLVHKFRGLEIGGSYGNSDLGASNDMGEWEAWIKAGTGDDKTDIVVVADFWERTGGIFSADRDLSSNGNFVRFGGTDNRSGFFPGHLGGFVGLRLLPSLFFSANTPPPHSAPNKEHSPFYISPTSPFFNHGHGFFDGTLAGLDGNFVAFNFASITPDLPPGDRQVYYGSFT
ncbi:MAG TPA: TonB-dependent receptor plug domain-containing protein, partial [Candidatus Udaeobacter sp.]|nr:TonB-dependent receptor plug domain-containing protein [Candidatus Udaeobacter sp.]